MTEVSLQLVRECLELHLFRVTTYWQHEDDGPRVAESAALLFVESRTPDMPAELPFLLRDSEFTRLSRAVIEVRAWHGDRLYPSVVENNPILAHVTSAEVRALAEDVFQGAPYASVLVFSELPQSPKQQERALELLRDLGLDHAVEFPTVLQQMLARINAHGSYAPSATLQTLRLLKRYNLLRRQQLEFAFPMEPHAPAKAPPIDVTMPQDNADTGDE